MRWPVLSVLMVAVGFGALPSAAAQSPANVELSVSAAGDSVVLGDSLQLRVTVANRSADPTAPLAVHLDVTDPTSTTSVDPEDWTTTLTRSVGVLAPQATTSLEWTVQPVAAGTYTVYTVALSAGSEALASSNALQVTVQDRRTLDPGGILPVALGVPLLVGALLLLQRWWARRSPGGDSPGF